MKIITYKEIKVVQIINRDTLEGEQAWNELTQHHALPFVKEGRYPLEYFWLAYNTDPYENLEVCKEDYGAEWSGEGMLGKVVADYLKSKNYSGDYTDILLHVTW